MSIYGKILFDHQNFQDLMSPSSTTNTRQDLANLLLANGPLSDKFNTEANARAEEDTKLKGQITEVQNLANSTKNTVDSLMGTKEDKEEIENLMNSLKAQLGENGVAKLLARVQYLEDVLFSEKYGLIIGEIDDNQAIEPPTDI